MAKISPVTIGLLWHSANSDNLGIGALTASQVAILDEAAQQLGLAVRYKVLCWKDPAEHYIRREDIEVVALRSRDLLRFSGFYAAVRGCDLVLDISTGDAFADIYGARRITLNFLSKTVVLLARRPLILSPQTIGPFERWWARLLAKWLMRTARRIVTRDGLSSDFVRELGLGGKLLEATDVAFRLPFDHPPPRSARPVRVGLNVSGLLFNGGYTRRNMFALTCDYPELVRMLLKHFSAQPDCELHLIGHVNSLVHEVEDDYRVAELLAAEFPGTIVAPRFATPSAAKSYMATMDFFAGSRMHACIAAFSSGVPVMPVAYSRKFAGLFGSLGYDHVVDCRSQDTVTALSAIVDAFERRGQLKAEVESALKIANDKLSKYQLMLCEFLRHAACQPH